MIIFYYVFQVQIQTSGDEEDRHTHDFRHWNLKKSLNSTDISHGGVG